jgi:rare lipoprotein A
MTTRIGRASWSVGRPARRLLISALLAVGVTVSTVAMSSTADAAAVKTCRATWYGAIGEIPEGWPTASGAPLHRLALRAASNELPFGTRVRVTFGGRSVTVKINDRGNFRRPVCLDLTFGAFRRIADPDLGNIEVRYQVL